MKIQVEIDNLPQAREGLSIFISIGIHVCATGVVHKEAGEREDALKDGNAKLTMRKYSLLTHRNGGSGNRK